MMHGTALWKGTMIREHRRDILVGRLEACAGTYAGCPSHPQARHRRICDFWLEAATLTFATEAVQSCLARSRGGVALLVVLFVIMVITVTSIGFLSKSDVELACGRNMELWTEVGYTGESGLEEARGLIISPQEIDSEYWHGGDDRQIVVGGDDYYNVRIDRDDSDPTDRCNYTIDCNSYRLQGGEKVGRSNLTAQLRLDPCIAYWIGTATRMSRRITINGDMYCAGSVASCAEINGDVFSKSSISGSDIEGQSNRYVSESPVDHPGIEMADYYPNYYIGAGSYSSENIGSSVHPSGTFNPSSGNPGGIRYYAGSAELLGGVNINGMLAIDGHLRVSGVNSISAVKNFPALLVAGDLIIEPGGELDVNGLVVVEEEVQISSDGGRLDVTGALFTWTDIAETVVDSSENGNDCVINSDIAWVSTGGYSGGSALEFDGDHDYVRTSDNSTKLQLTGDYTFSVWVKPDSTQKIWAGVFSKCDIGGEYNHWTLQFNADSAKRLVIHHPSQLWDTGITLSEIAGAWHHIVVVRSGTTMTSYLDGDLRASGALSNDPGSGVGHLNIGADRTASYSYLYKGLINDVRIYNAAADPNHIYPPDGNLIGHWRLDESGCDVDITAAPCKTALMRWSSEGFAEKWEQAGGAFFRSIIRRR